MASRRPRAVSALPQIAVYWDASAILSALFADTHSRQARASLASRGLHLMSSLAWSEVHAVIARIERENGAEALASAARESISKGPWRYLNASPHRDVMRDLASKWSLRGADLWHLALAKTLQPDLHAIALLSFDSRLRAAARGEGLAS